MAIQKNSEHTYQGTSVKKRDFDPRKTMMNGRSMMMLKENTCQRWKLEAHENSIGGESVKMTKTVDGALKETNRIFF